MFVELLCLPSHDVAQPVPDMTSKLGIRRPRAFRCPLGRRLNRHAISISELLAGDPPVVCSPPRRLLLSGAYPQLALHHRRTPPGLARRKTNLFVLFFL